MRHRDAFNALIDTMKVAVAVLREAEVEFMLGGSMAAWARGGPEPDNDLDLMVSPDHADAALEALSAAGMRTERPPEEWLYKAWHDDVLIDLIFRPSGVELTGEVFTRADAISVMAITMPVMALEDALVTMLYALDLREQIDWPVLRRRASGSPYAKAFLTLVEELEIAPRASRGAAAPRDAATEETHSRVRVVGSAE
jgi:hypothetical protein